MGTFAARAQELSDMVGHGKLTGTVIVDQRYSAAQHQGMWATGPLAGHVIKEHPHGGQAHFLDEPLMTDREKFVRRLADRALDEDGLRSAMIENVEALADAVFERAPREFEDLRNSAHPTVTDDGAIVYDRPPVRERLSEEQLREKNRRRRHGEGP